MDDVIVVSGTASNGVADGIAKALDVPLISIDKRILADGESYVRVPGPINGKDVVLVQSTYPPQDKHLIELFLILDALKGLVPRRIVVVVPYLAYSRQNKRFMDGEPISAEAVIKLIRSSGADALITIEPHRLQSLNVFEGKTMAVDPVPLYAAALPGALKKPVVLSPDNGGLDRANRFAAIINAPSTFIDKERDKLSGEVRIRAGSDFDFNGRDVIIIDDVISTGNTVAQAARFVKMKGAGKIIVIAAHLIMVGSCIDKLKKSNVFDIIGSNSVPSKGTKVVDASRLLADAVLTILSSK